MSRSHFRRGLLGAGLLAGGLLGVEVARYKRGTRQRFEMSQGPGPGSGSEEFARLVTAMTGAPLRAGNRVQIIRNGPTLDAMVEAISSARQTIDLSSYIYWPGPTADRFSHALIERARAGVEVNVVLDGYGSAKLDEAHLERLRQGGVNVSMFRPPRWYNVKRLNNRMHRRILVVDGGLAFAGGVGIADVWTGDAQDPEHWRETHLRIEGPAVLDIFGAFLETWTEATTALLVGTHIAESDSFGDGVALQVTKSTPTGGATAASEVFFAAIAGARERLWLTTAYFAPDRTFEHSLCDATRRGVDVRIMVNGQEVDKEVARKAGQRSYGKLLEAGARIFEYDRTMLHAKVLLVDEKWANVGSGKLRQPLARPRPRAQRGHNRCRPGRGVERSLPRRSGGLKRDRLGDVEEAAPAGTSGRNGYRGPASVIVSDCFRTVGRYAALR